MCGTLTLSDTKLTPRSAVAISAYGPNSPQALASTVGPLVE
jgi:ACR3 family arsenite efflux pump ArsB